MNDALGPLNLAVLAFPGAALLWTTQLVYGRRGAGSDDVLKRVLTIAGWLMLLLALIGGVVGMAGPFSLLALPILPAVMLMVVGQYRISERRALLDVLAIAAEAGVPLDAAARAFAAERSDDLGLRANRLAELLESGMALPEALANSGHYFLPTDARLAVRYGCDSGALGPALRRLSGVGNNLDAMFRAVSVRFLYFMVVLNWASAILGFVMLKIVPVFAKMFDEFELKLPPPTLLLVSISNKIIKIWPFLLPLELLLLVLVLAAGLHYLGWLPRWLPVVSLLSTKYDGTLIMRTLALAVNQERSLVETLRLLSRQYPLAPVRYRLARAVAAIDHGADWCDALVSVGLIRTTDAAVLKAAQRVGNLEWALTEMADSGMRRAAYRWQAVMNVLTPIIILLGGMIVAFVVISLFMPLISLIRGLS